MRRIPAPELSVLLTLGVLLGTICAAAPPLPGAPVQRNPVVRAAFYYPWYPESWTQSGTYPYTNYTPAPGYYRSEDPGVIRRHIAEMQYGHIDAGIASWWGQGTATDSRIPALLAAAKDSGFRWSLYYEAEGTGNPTPETIRNDLLYIRDRYASDPAYLHVDGRFVVFVYGDEGDDCGMADRWNEANTAGAYVVLKVFGGYRSCAHQPDGWHQYAPSRDEDRQDDYSFMISPGFYKEGEAPRLARNLARWRRNIRNMIASNAQFQLVLTFNEWGEGTAVEPAAEWQSPSGYGSYLDALHEDGKEPQPDG